MNEPMPNLQGLLLVDHGSTKAESNAQLLSLCELLQSYCPGVVVAGAHMELATPSVSEQVSALAARGVVELTVVPYFLAPGRHAREDIPRLLQEAVVSHPQIQVHVGECLGIDDLLAQLVLKRARAAGLKLA